LSRQGRRRLGARRRRAAITTAAALVASAAFTGTASADLGAPGPITQFNGHDFPEFYADAANQQLTLCLDGINTACGADAFDLDPPDGEGLYWAADSADIALSGGGTVAVSFALQAAFGGADDATPITMSSRIYRFENAAPGTYTVQTPWGPDTVTNAGARNEGTDSGCDPALGETCDFTAASRTLISTFLHGAGASGEFLGAGPDADPGPVAGSPIGFNAVSISGPSGSGSTSDFAITGKFADGAGPVPLLAAAPAGFGAQTTGTSAVKTVTVRNDGMNGAAGLTVGTPAIAGADASDFAIAGNTCAAAVPVGGSCQVSVRFTPSAAGARSATLTLPSNANTGTVALSGTGAAPVVNPTQPAGGAGNVTVVTVRRPATPGSSVQGIQARSLAVSRLTLARRISISRVRARGLRLSLDAPAGARVVRVAIYRARNGRKTGRALFVGFRNVAAPGRVVVTLRSRSLLRKLRAGQYVVEIRPGTSRAALGVTATRTFRITR